MSELPIRVVLNICSLLVFLIPQNSQTGNWVVTKEEQEQEKPL